MQQYTLKLEHKFCAAHKLIHAYAKECNDNIHGHSWLVKIEIKTPTLLNEMVIDFKKVKEIINTLDHKNLNDILDFEPTAENIAHYLYKLLFNEMSKDLKRLFTIKVEVFESDDASITYEV